MCCSPEAFVFPELGVPPQLRIRRRLAAFDVEVLRLIAGDATELFEKFRALPPDLRNAVPDSADLTLNRLLEIEKVLDADTLPIPRKAVLIHQLRLGMTLAELAAA